MPTAPTFLTQVWLHKRVHEAEAAGHQVVIAGGDSFLQLLTYQLYGIWHNATEQCCQHLQTTTHSTMGAMVVCMHGPEACRF